MAAGIANGRRKPLVIHHHGSRFRNTPGRVWREGVEAGAALQVVSTVDLLLSVPSGGVAEWMPQPIDLPHLARIRAENPPAEPLTISHAPTNRRIKGTTHYVMAAHQLGARLRVVQHAKWEACLAIKAKSDIYLDQMWLGYGNNALEAWGLGLPVISGAYPNILARMRREYVLPFLEANPGNLVPQLRSLIESADLRAEWAARGMDHVRQYHAPDAFAERALGLFERAILQSQVLAA